MHTEPKPRILLVDDDPAHRGFMGRALGYEGYQVVLAEGGQQALELARGARPDLVLLDLMMPDLGGLEVAHTLHQEGFRAPILLVSANDEPHTREQARRLGLPLLGKPVSLDELLDRVARALRTPA